MGSAASIAASTAVTSASTSELQSLVDGLPPASKEKLIAALSCDAAPESKGKAKPKEEQEEKHQENTQAEEPDGSLVHDSKEKTKRDEAEEDAVNQRRWSNQSVYEHPRGSASFPYGRTTILSTSLMLDYRGHKVVLTQRSAGNEDESDGEGCLVTSHWDERDTYTGTWYEARDLVITCQRVSNVVECTTVAGNCIATFEAPPEQEAYGDWLAEKLSEILGRDPGLRLVLMNGSGEIFWTKGEVASAGQIVLLLTKLHQVEGRMTLCGSDIERNWTSRVTLTDDDAVMSPLFDPKLKPQRTNMHFSKLRREPKI